MAATVTTPSPNPSRVSGNYKLAYRQFVFDNSYTTGGYTATAATFGLRRIIYTHPGLAINDQGAGDSTKTLFVRRNATTNKLQAFWSAGSGAAPVEVTGTTDLSTYRVIMEAVGY